MFRALSIKTYNVIYMMVLCARRTTLTDSWFPASNAFILSEKMILGSFALGVADLGAQTAEPLHLAQNKAHPTLLYLNDDSILH